MDLPCNFIQLLEKRMLQAKDHLIALKFWLLEVYTTFLPYNVMFVFPTAMIDLSPQKVLLWHPTTLETSF